MFEYKSAIEFWMTEYYCILANNIEIKGSGRDLGMNTDLHTARVIFSDLVLANASSWQWWLAVSHGDYKDGLVYTDNDKFDGNIYDSKLLWPIGNFSRFIKSGMSRLDVTRSDLQTLEEVMCTAFVSDDKSEIPVVLINYSKSAVPIKLNLKDLNVRGNLALYITNDTSSNLMLLI